MKGLKKIALASAIAAVSAGAQAELKALDDSAMGELTGQAGLTIDIESQLSIGEFAYVDAGAVVFKDIYRGGKDDSTGARTLMDNIRLTLDVAGAGESFNYGMSEVRGLAGFMALQGGADAAVFADVNAGDSQDLALDGTTDLSVDETRAAGNGDLVLHFGFTDAWQAGGGFAAYMTGNGLSDLSGSGTATDMTGLSWVNARDVATKAVDFQMEIGQIALADSGYGALAAGEYANGRLGTEVIAKTDHISGADADAAGANTTTLISDLKMSGYLGPMDIIIENNGNGFSNDPTDLNAAFREGLFDAAGVAKNGGTADSKILWDSYVKVTDLDLYIDIAGVKLEDIRIHNERGDLSGLNTATNASGAVTGSSSFGFAHSKREIYAVKDAVLSLENYGYQDFVTGGNATAGDFYVDGIAINTQFKGDIDIGALKFGDTDTSIGSLYFTDIESTTNWTISAHH